MSRFFFTLLLLSSGTAVAAEDVPLRLSEPVEVTASHEIFGAPMDSHESGVSLEAVLADAEELDGEEVRVTTRVAKVCQKKGCFFIAQEGDAVARVTFKDYEFFVPTDSADKAVTLVGTFSRQAIDQDKADHFARDLGESEPALLDRPFEYAIVATSVMIPKS